MAPCPEGYTNATGHVNATTSYDVAANFEECERLCTNQLFNCASFEYCGYYCDPSIGAPYTNRCIINREYQFEEVPSLENFFRCAKGKQRRYLLLSNL